MARPKREITMARCAGSALLAAIEIYNKPTVEYREQTLAFLVTNAWEVLLKARLIQQAGGRIETLYRRDSRSQRYMRDDETHEPLTIGLRQVLSLVLLPNEVRANIKGLIEVRNRAVHLGILSAEARERILGFGTASVHNFVKLSNQWFGPIIKAPYLLPVAFAGHAVLIKETYPGRQRDLIKALDNLANSSGSADSEFSVVMHVDINVNRGLSGGGNIGMTTDPDAPSFFVSDEELLEYYSLTYNDVVAKCKERYSDFIRNPRFYELMRSVKADPNCVHKRRLDPNNQKSPFKMFYNPDATFATLDGKYTKINEPSHDEG